MTEAQSVPNDVVHYYERWLPYRQWLLRVPGVQAAVLDDSGPRLNVAFGQANIERDEPLTSHHLFRIASHSKTFTAVCVMQLVEQGKVRLDDTAGALRPELADTPVAALTVRELLSHGSGVIRDSTNGDFWQLMQPFPDQAELDSILRADSAAVIPANERFKYSNIAYGLLGLIIEAVSGDSFNARMAKTITTPLELHDTGPELPADRANDLAAGHSALAYSRERRVIPHVDTRALAAATGCYATAGDLVRFYQALLPDRTELLTEASLRQLQHRQWPMKEGKSAYGFGIMVAKVGDHELFGHGGGYPGHITRTLACPDRRAVVSVLTNAIDGPAESLASALFTLSDLAAKADHGSAPGPTTQFEGRFSSLWDVLDIAALGGRLFALDPTAADPADEPTPLEVIDEHTLKIVGGSGTGAYGELISYDFAPDGTVRSVRGPSAATMTPFELPAD